MPLRVSYIINAAALNRALSRARRLSLSFSRSAHLAFFLFASAPTYERASRRQLVPSRSSLVRIYIYARDGMRRCILGIELHVVLNRTVCNSQALYTLHRSPIKTNGFRDSLCTHVGVLFSSLSLDCVNSCQ